MTITLLPKAAAQTQHIVMTDITWETYKSLLKDLGDGRSARLAYDEGILEIILPSASHGCLTQLIAFIVMTLVEELGWRVTNYGSTTLDREDLKKGVEPDYCFYIQNVDRILGKRLNLATDPPQTWRLK